MCKRGKNKQNIGLPAVLLGLYFILLPLDCFSLGQLGSLLRVVALLPVIALIGYGGCKRLYLNGVSCGLIGFMVLSIMSFFWTVSAGHTLNALKTLLLNGTMVLITGACLEYTGEEVKWLRKCLVTGSWFTALLMLIFGRFVDGRLILTIGENVQDANYVNGFMLFAISNHLNGLFDRRRVLHLIPLAILMPLVFASGSRGAVVACLGCLAAHMLPALRSGWQRVVFAIFLLAALTGFMTTVIINMKAELIERFLPSYILQYGFTGRVDIWRHLWDIFADSNVFRQVLGYGYGTTVHLTAMSELTGVQGKVAHNLYLDMFLNLGVAGIAIFAGMHKAVLICLRRHKDRMLLAVHIGFLIMCLSLSLISYKPMWALIIFAIIQDAHVRNGCIRREGGNG